MAINLVPETLASPEDEQAKMIQQLNATRAKQGGQQVNLPQQKGVLSQFGDMAKEKVMSDAVNTGSKAMYDKGAAMFASQAAAPGTASLMANQAAMTQAAGLGGAATTGLATAMPYVGAGLLAGKALGFFNNGGHVGPLYASEGRKTPEGKSIADQIKYFKDKEYYEALDQARDDYLFPSYKSSGGPLYAADGSMPMPNDGGMAGPLSKVKYKSAGGEVYELSYGGRPLKKEK